MYSMSVKHLTSLKGENLPPYVSLGSLMDYNPDDRWDEDDYRDEFVDFEDVQIFKDEVAICTVEYGDWYVPITGRVELSWV